MPADNPLPPTTHTQSQGLVEPLDARTHRLLRQAVLEHVTTERRRVHLPLVHVGTPGGTEVMEPVRPDEPGDHALRADIVSAMLRRLHRVSPADDSALVWLTRAGGLDLQDVDAQWLASARTAYDERCLPLRFVIVNRHGWRDPRTALSRTWRRLRPR